MSASASPSTSRIFLRLFEDEIHLKDGTRIISGVPLIAVKHDGAMGYDMLELLVIAITSARPAISAFNIATRRPR